MRAAAFALIALIAAPAAAQTNPVVEHYHAYQAAYARGDLDEAEVEAAAALSASEQRDGDGGHTAVFAMNLATTRLLNGHGAQALVPAQRAEALARGGAAGVDPLMARLVLAHAELAADPASTTAEAHAREALEAASTRGDLAHEAYVAAAALGAHAFAGERFTTARFAFESAVQTSANADVDPIAARASANIGIAASIVMAQPHGHSFQRDIGVANTALTSAATVLGAYRSEPIVEGRLTPHQREYVRAIAWASALRARALSMSIQLPDDYFASNATTGMLLGPLPEGTAPCHVHVVPTITPLSRLFPPQMLSSRKAGSAVLLFHVSSDGSILGNEVVAGVGQAFADSLASNRSSWRIERQNDSEEGCELPQWVLVPINFALR